MAILCTHPIQYYSPWFRHLAEQGESLSGGLGLSNEPQGSFSFEVLYAHKQTAKGQAEAGFGVEFEWDVPLLEGYPYRFLKNVSTWPGLDRFGGCDCPEIGEILAKEGFTHVLLTGWHKKVFWQAFWAAKKAGIKVLSRGDSQLGMTSSPLKRAIKYMLYRFLLTRFDAHLFVGRRNREYLLHYGVKDARLFFSPHFVDNQWWSSRAKAADENRMRMRIRGSDEAESENRKAEKSVNFLFAGKFIPKKRVMDLLEAAAGVREARVVLVGDGPLRSKLEARAGHADLKGRVEFVGFKNQKELPAYLAAGDCLVLPSDGTETWGLIVNEAMACGKPAIVSDACGCEPDLIVQGETGYSFPLGDTRTLAERLREFVRHRDQDWSGKVCAKISNYSMNRATIGLFQAFEKIGDRR